MYIRQEIRKGKGRQVVHKKRREEKEEMYLGHDVKMWGHVWTSTLGHVPRNWDNFAGMILATTAASDLTTARITPLIQEEWI